MAEVGRTWPRRGTRTRPRHALAVTMYEHGALVGTPVVHEDVRDERGRVHLPGGERRDG